jgi:asparagine synthase (glutamine-hydrolysing)
MCGVIGIASNRQIPYTEILGRSRDAMYHRGPDSAGEWWSSDKKVGLAHRRLSIIDLTETASQPMHNEDRDLCIVFNGEIYNYQELRKELKTKGIHFQSNSDTEVILACYKIWGTDCLSHLNGMFAFALFDSKAGKLFLARDRAGEKPLFYSYKNNQLQFSSELKGLLEDKTFNRKIDYDSLNKYLAEGFVSGQHSILEGANKLPPAHAMTFDVNTGYLHIWNYWTLPQTEHYGTQPNESGLLAELEQLLEDSVRRQLIADVPVGILLSGGTDSSLVTAMAARVRPKIMTFTVRFPEFASHDESEYARLIANHFQTEHHELDAHASSVDLLPKLAKQYDEPLIDSSMIPTFLVCEMIRQHCTVALGGDGGDELFGGYRHYNRLLWLQAKAKKIPLSIRNTLVKSLQNKLPIGYSGRNWLQAFGTDLASHVPLIASYFDFHFRKKLIGARAKEVLVNDGGKDNLRNGMDLLQRATRTDFLNYLPEDILVKVDRASMLNSLEVRAPMLDYRLIEFAFDKVPSCLKAAPDQRKILLKKLAGRILPPQFDSSRKQGFAIPLSSWLQKKKWKDFFQQVLLDKHQTLFDHSMIEEMFKEQNKGYNNGERLFGLLMFELWRKEYNISV